MNGRGWSQADVTRLIDLYELNTTYPAIAAELARSEAACKNKVVTLRRDGLIAAPGRVAGRRAPAAGTAPVPDRYSSWPKASGPAKPGENFNLEPMSDAEINGIDGWYRASLSAADRKMQAAMATVRGGFQDIRLKPREPNPVQAGVLLQPNERRALP